MEYGYPRCEEESTPRIRVSIPAVEALLYPQDGSTFWSPEVSENPLFKEQLEKRQALSHNLHEVLHSLPSPTMDIATAVKKGYLSERQVAELYEKLGKLLQDEDYSRLALYLPFEFLPDVSWAPASADLQQAATEFRESYLYAWSRLLGFQDVQANFVDGDVLEVEQRTTDLQRVVKAAHFIPMLAEKGIINIKDVMVLMQGTSDPTLIASIADTAPILLERGLISEDQFNFMNQLVGGVAAEEEPQEKIATSSFKQLRARLDQDLRERVSPPICFSFWFLSHL